MNSDLLVAMLPLLLPAATAVIHLVALCLMRHHLVSLILTLVGLTASLVVLWVRDSGENTRITPLFILDDFARVGMAALFVSTMLVVLFSYAYLKMSDRRHGEYYVLMMLAVLGAATLVASVHFVSIFLGLELLSLSLVVMMAYFPDRELCVEAGIKYFVMASASSACLLFGLALMYASTGTMELVRFIGILNTSNIDLVLFSGLAMVVVGIGFKLALVPFHLWVSDVYQGAPAPVTSFVATVSKGAVLVVLIKLFVWIDGWSLSWWWVLVAALAAASMTIGNLLALLQSNIKRILAYSSISHLGYALVAVLAGGKTSLAAAVFYLLVYMLMSLGAFGVVAACSGKDSENDELDRYRNLGKQRPILAFVMAVMMFSLSGVPLTAGFTGKLFVLMSGVGSKLWFLVVVLLINSAVGLYVYLRVVVVMYMTPLGNGCDSMKILPEQMVRSQGLVLVMVSALVIILGVYPKPFLDLAHWATAGLF